MRTPWSVLVGLGLVWSALTGGAFAEILQKPSILKFSSIVLCASTLAVFSGLIFHQSSNQVWVLTNADIVLLAAWAILLASLRREGVEHRTQWKLLSVIWMYSGTAIWLAASYLKNQQVPFYSGLAGCLLLLILTKHWFRLPTVGIQMVNTVILLFVGIPLLSVILWPKDHFDLIPKLDQDPYSYEFARNDPAAYARWWRYNHRQFSKFSEAIGRKSERLRPNTTVPFYECSIPINSKGFRGREISDQKGDDYRIVALGESTTFGLTMRQEDRSWPELLEQIIQQGLHSQRQVRVINAGVPGFSLKENFSRLITQILPLHPDMIISYHGINGFPMIYQGMPPIHGNEPPVYRTRPLALLANFEYQLKVIDYKRHLVPTSDFQPAFFSSPMESEYARLYRQLIRISHTNEIRLALATFSMAVNEQSPRDVLDFYRTIGLEVDRQVIANETHTFIVRQLAQKNPEVCFVDTRPVLDGDYADYIDLVHFTQEGREKLAEVFFNGIKDTLRRDLASSDSADATNGAPGDKRGDF